MSSTTESRIGWKISDHPVYNYVFNATNPSSFEAVGILKKFKLIYNQCIKNN